MVSFRAGFLAARIVAAALARNPPPLYSIAASSLRDAGLQHGQLAGERIRTWLESDEIADVWAFARAAGHVAYETLRRESSEAFPQYAAELAGIAEGAGVDLDKLWAAQLMIELENLMGDAACAEHCSDIFAVAPGGFDEGFAHGHNEDWGPVVRELYYYVNYTATEGADFESCAGFAYPGSLIGWGPTWNSHGVLMTVNTLFPKRIRESGFSTAFVQREAMCGIGKGRGLHAVVDGLTRHGWSAGASMNLVDLRGRRMANVEVYEDQHDVLEVTEEMGNYTHFNLYKRLGNSSIDWPQASTMNRQARADFLAAPRSRDDIAEILSDVDGTDYPIWRDITIATLLTDGATGRLDAYCCGESAATHAPAHSWDVLDFFGAPATAAEPLVTILA